jgi:hypothetical protein
MATIRDPPSTKADVILAWKQLYLDLDVVDTFPTKKFAVE